MAFSKLFLCDACDFDIVLIHAMEWTPGENGAIVPYPGYGPIGGLANRLWCPHCRQGKEHVFVRLNPPGNHAVIAYAEAQRLQCTGEETGPCTVCGGELTWEVDGTGCPACKNGVLHFTGEWEDAV